MWSTVQLFTPFSSLQLLFCPWLSLLTLLSDVSWCSSNHFPGFLSYHRYLSSEGAEAQLCLENKSSFLLCLYNGHWDTLICHQSTLRALLVQQQGKSESCLRADGLGLVLKTRAHTRTVTSIYTLHWWKEALGVYFFKRSLRKKIWKNGFKYQAGAAFFLYGYRVCVCVCVRVSV